ncbi:hypothetical protein AVEN_159591-1 [Araneus ventricosus]|uniref:Uncharacterized protein n=1 Tax=Araneus ventricosus TaxID=182803 RepID=A0A4Y2HFX0_ARAVE|nr:hypothetical protein AVEN_159591-1 [Araneus ventricosus]
MSRISAITFPSKLGYVAISEAQNTDQELCSLMISQTFLRFKKVTLPNSVIEVIPDSTCKPAFLLNTDDNVQIPQVKNQTLPPSEEPTSTALTPPGSDLKVGGECVDKQNSAVVNVR